jgi:hypothetical protein
MVGRQTKLPFSIPSYPLDNQNDMTPTGATGAIFATVYEKLAISKV